MNNIDFAKFQIQILQNPKKIQNPKSKKLLLLLQTFLHFNYFKITKMVYFIKDKVLLHWKVWCLTKKSDTDKKLKELYDEDKLSHHDSLAKLGIMLYPYKFEKALMVGEVLEKFKEIQEDPSSEIITTAGRLISKRGHGKVIFMDLRDITGKIQLYFRLNDLGKEKFEIIKQHIEVGDHIGVNGSVFRTRMGEITIFVKDFELLSKSLAILPEKYHGLQNVELRYRKRYRS